MRKLSELVDACLKRFNESRARGFQHAGVTQIVDIFGGAAEVNELESSGARASRAQLLPDVILNRFHIVIDAGFDDLHGFSGTVVGVVRKLPRAFDDGSG